MQKKKAATSAGEPWPKGVAKPAQRALVAAGYTSVDQLANARQADLAALHGMGAKALDILRNALKQSGKSFRG
ncbi:MAG: helix-hairpin-helix domain-containing protein [Terracidiphilus sp.]